jgi:hypothetical protein
MAGAAVSQKSKDETETKQAEQAQDQRRAEVVVNLFRFLLEDVR